MDANRFQRDKEIDPNALDVECVSFADRFYHWAEAAVEAGYQQDRAKLKLDVTKARLEIQCRQTPESFGLDRATDKGVEAAVLASEAYQSAYNDWLEARKEAKILDKAVDSMDAKKRMLDNLIRLHGQQYFAGPSVPHDLPTTWKEYQEKLTVSVNQKQRLRTRRRERS